MCSVERALGECPHCAIDQRARLRPAVPGLDMPRRWKQSQRAKIGIFKPTTLRMHKLAPTFRDPASREPKVVDIPEVSVLIAPASWLAIRRGVH
jgi:hypothetical protein